MAVLISCLLPYKNHLLCKSIAKFSRSSLRWFAWNEIENIYFFKITMNMAYYQGLFSIFSSLCFIVENFAKICSVFAKKKKKEIILFVCDAH